MSALTERLRATRQAIQPVNIVTWTREGQNFKQWATKGIVDQLQYELCNELVAKINNNQITIEAAVLQFNNSLWAGR